MTRQSPYAWPPPPSRAPQHAAAVNGNAAARGRARRAMKLFLIASVWVTGLFAVIAAVTMVAMATGPVARTSGADTPVTGPSGGATAGGGSATAGHEGSGGGQAGQGRTGQRRTGERRTGDNRTGPSPVRHTGASAPTRIHAVYASTGSANTSQFTIGGNGTWKIAWSYHCAGLHPNGSFTVGQDGAASVDGAYITRLGAAGRGVTWAFKDAGTHYLAIRTQCRWRITVTS
jgi:hypothetical protein